MEVQVKFEPKQIVLDGTVYIYKNNEIIEQYDDTFAYKWNQLGEIIDLLH